MAHVLVTGGTGFLGQHLVRELVQRGDTVDVLDLSPPRVQIAPLEKLCTRIIYGTDITQCETLDEQLGGVDIVYHLAGLVSFQRRHAAQLFEVNVQGTANVLQAALRCGVGRVVHVSSVAAIGFGKARESVDENLRFDWSRVTAKHYMTSKHLAELEVARFVQRGLQVVVANPGLMWGPGDMLNSWRLIQAIHERNLLMCPPGGTNVVDVRDIARGLPKLAAGGMAGQRYILGGANVTFQKIFSEISAALGRRRTYSIVPRWSRRLLCAGALVNEITRTRNPGVTADQMDSAFRFRYFSSAKARDQIGWRPTIPFAETVYDSVAWLKSRNLL